MLFDPKALANKKQHLDEILSKPETLRRVLGRNLGSNFTWVQIPRVWDPGGGATLFKVEADGCRYLLKVKHRSVTVESRLESESYWMDKPSLQNEYDLISNVHADWVPRVRFYVEEEELQFLALEWLQPFPEAIDNMSGPGLWRVWQAISKAAKELFDKGIVHTDIHEHNICFRDGDPVLCDFEEARYIRQQLPFEKSLDVVGENLYGSVGQFPQGHGPRGLTCLKRLESIFKRMIEARLPDMLAQCNFDNACPFNLDRFQQPDERTYQSVALGNLRMTGQRPHRDARELVFEYLLCRLAREIPAIHHLDIGSNLGKFCFISARLPFVVESIGVEAHPAYIDCARCLAFVQGLERVHFVQLICGQDSVSSIIKSAELVTMLSVYHHIGDKAAFLRDMRALEARAILAEFAVQERYYPERGSLEKELAYVQAALGFPECRLLCVSRDYGRPLVLLSYSPLSAADWLFMRLASRGLQVISRVLLWSKHQRLRLGR
jgi:tRNA A-37 threonylcarbamoyl transferase component Bud32